MTDPNQVSDVVVAPERDARGWFQPGNRIAKGHENPHARKTQELRRALMNAVTAEDVRAVALVLVEKAKAGDVIAAKELLDRVIGKAAEAEVLAGVEALELRVLRLVGAAAGAEGGDQ